MPLPDYTQPSVIVAFIDGNGQPVTWTTTGLPVHVDVGSITATIGAVTLADGADTTEGAVADTAVVDPTASATVVAALKGVVELSQPRAITTLVQTATTLATRTGTDITNVRGNGINLVVTLAAKANSPSITPKIQGKTKSGAYYDLWTAAAALTGNGTYVYQLSPSALATAGGVTEGKIALIPGTFRVVLTYAGNGTTDSFTTTADVDVS